MRVLLIALIRFALRFIVPFVLPFILPFSRKVDDDINPKGQPVAQRRRLPKMFAWLETPDQTLPGGLYESTVNDIYEKWGWFIASWYWLGWRNVAFGLAWQFGKPVRNYMVHLSPEEKKQYGVYEKRTEFLGLAFITGYAIYEDWYAVSVPKVNGRNGFWAVERISIRLASQD